MPALRGCPTRWPALAERQASRLCLWHGPGCKLGPRQKASIKVGEQRYVDAEPHGKGQLCSFGEADAGHTAKQDEGHRACKH
eukprot:7187551-Alexandrium_andersonii.AAC.2